MKTKITSVIFKSTLVLIVSVFVMSNTMFAQKAYHSSLVSSIFSGNSEVKLIKAEVRLNSIMKSIENTVRFNGPVVAEEEFDKGVNAAETANEKSSNTVLSNTSELRIWLQNKLIKDFSYSNNHEYGKAKVRFVVDKSGKITDCEVVSVSDLEFEKPVKKALEAAPMLKPVTMNGYPAKVKFELPIYFQILNK